MKVNIFQQMFQTGNNSSKQASPLKLQKLGTKLKIMEDKWQSISPRKAKQTIASELLT